MASLSFEQVEKVYANGHRAIAPFDLNVEDGELMVLVGPSGCGKSTLLRLVAGLEEVSAGAILIDGKTVQAMTPRERNIAMVFQDYALYPTMSVRANLEFPLKMRRLPRPEIFRRVDWVSELLALGEVLERLPKQLSGGQRQRVAMGRALVREPSVFLLDEPLSNLDAKLRAQVRAEIGELQRRIGATMIYVTHDQTEAMTLGQRIAVLDRGRLQQVAVPDELYARPANAFVASFIGTPPMNLFTAEIREEHDALRIEFAGQTIARLEDVPQRRKWRSGIPVQAGIRPEALRIVGAGEYGFRAVVAASEFLGHETLIHCRPGAKIPHSNPITPWVVRIPGRCVYAAGDGIRLAVAAEAVHLFDR